MSNQQPNFHALGQYLVSAATEFGRFSNITPVVEAQRFDHLENQYHGLMNQNNDLRNYLEEQFRRLQGQISELRQDLNTSVSRITNQITTLQRQYNQDQITQRARHHNAIVKIRNQHDLIINPHHQLLPLRNVFTGDKIPNCPRTKGEIRRLRTRDVNRFFAFLDLPQDGTLNEKRQILVDNFC